MLAKEWDQVSADNMIAKIGRNISDAQAAVGRAIVVVGLMKSRQRSSVLFVPAAMLLSEFSGVAGGGEKAS